ncbi:MAG: ABC transporter substrate-binding protein [Eubacteriaceae bacterium]|jgi:branched-chain amino acid transport system substrate-binding protein|nr:ABC transporter substrate-binding protein [Eubacteriaceae bacterium]
MKKRLALMLVLIMVMMTLAACGGGSDDSSDQAADSGDVIKIGATGPYTGETAMYGVACKEGMELAEKEINENGGVNGKKIKIVFYDTKGDTTETVNAYNRLRDQDEVVAFIGSVLTGESNAIKDLIKQDNMPTIAPTATGNDVTEGVPNFFRVCYYDNYQGGAAANYASKEAPEGLGAKSAAMLVSKGNTYSEGLAGAFKETFEKNGGEVVIEESYAKADKDFSAQLTKIKEANPDVIYIPDYYSTVGVILQKAKDMGMDIPCLGGDGWDSIQEEYADVAQGYVFTNHYAADSPNENVKKFTENYNEAYGKAPASFSALGYDAVYAMANAIIEAGSTDAQAVVSAIQTMNVTGITGEFTFDEEGNPKGKEVTIIQVDNGELKYVTTVTE